ncbi:MAG TPA: DUF1565 domain-containing protein [Leptolyngbyaceae cyanobacterium]
MYFQHRLFERKTVSLQQLHLKIPPKRGARCFWTIASLGLATSIPLWLTDSSAIATEVGWGKTQTPHQLIAQDSEQTSTSTQLYVNANTGNDSTGNGSDRAPFKTITQALRVAQSNTVIVLAPGVYSTESGETFPIELKPGVTIQGDPSSKGRGIVIKGGALFISPTFARQNIAVLAANNAGIAGVTITNPNRRGYGLWIESSNPVVADNTFTENTHDGISVTGNSKPLIRNNYFVNNGANGITVFNNSQPEIRANVFEKTGFGINIGQNAAPLLIENRIVENTDGVVVQGKAQPILRGNTIERNTRDGLVAITQARPDLGTSGQPGGNVFRNNGRFEINATKATQIISAFGNEMGRGRTAGRLDLAGTVAQTNPSVSETAQGEIPPTVVTSLPDAREIRSSNRDTPTTAVQIAVPAPVNSTISVSSSPPQQVSRSRTRRTRATRRTRRTRATRRTNVRALPTPSSANQRHPLDITPPSSASQNTVDPSSLVLESSNNSPINVNYRESSTPGRRTLPDSGVQPGLLPVPGSEIPIGNASMSTIGISQSNPRLTSSSNVGVAPEVSNSRSSTNRAIALGMRYRVVVDASSPRQQRLVRSMVPGAFRSRYNGRSVIQVGAYSDRQEAEEMLEKMNSNGFSAILEEL